MNLNIIYKSGELNINIYDTIFKNIKNKILNILELGENKLINLNSYFSNGIIEDNINEYDIIINNLEIENINDKIKFLKSGGVAIINNINLTVNENTYYEKLGEKLEEFEKYYFLTFNNQYKILVLIKKTTTNEYLIKTKSKITIITPSYRTLNLEKIYSLLNFDYIDEWIIVYDGNKLTENPKLFNHEKIKEYIYKNDNSSTGNSQRNYALEHITNKDTYLYFLDDDNIIHNDLYKLLDIIQDKDNIYTFNQNRIEGYQILKGNNINCNGIDTAMILASYNICKDIRWIEHIYAADFYYINDCYNKFNDKFIYIDNVLCYYNKLSR